MKNKIIISAITSMLLAGSSLVANTVELEKSLKNTGKYNISGAFAPYTFGEDSKSNWTFNFTGIDGAYQLLGEAGTDKNVFGWKKANITPKSPTFYMVNLGDWDKDGDTKFDWLVLTTDGKTIYKLAGADPKTGAFAYSSKLNVTATISADKTKLTIDGTAGKSVINGNVDLGALLPGTEERSLREETVLLPGVSPDTATVQVYDINDEDFSEPLLEEAVELNDDGSYDVTEDDFILLPGQDASFIIRAVAEKDGKNYEMSAVMLDRDKPVEINPITTQIRIKIIDTIKTIFGKDFKLTDDIKNSVNLLSVSISEQVEKDVASGKITLRETDFITDKKPSELDKKLTKDELDKFKEKEEKLKLQLQDTDATDDLSMLENELEDLKFEELKDKKIDLTKSSTDTDIARMEYGIISSFAKMGFAVHDGTGSIITFLPVPPEEFNKLPGSEFSITSVNEKIGNDPALRKINLSNDLNNVVGDEVWAMDLLDNLMENPIIPHKTIETMLQKRDNEITLQKLGEYLKDLRNPMTGEMLFKNDPIDKLRGVKLNENVKKSVENIVEKYEAELLKDDLEEITFNSFQRAMENDDLNKFLKLFEAKKNEEPKDFVKRLTRTPDFKREFDHILKEVGGKLAQSIPKDLDENDNKDFINFHKHSLNAQTVINPKIGMVLTDLLMLDANFDNSKIERVPFNDVFGFMNDKENADKKIWFVKSNEIDVTDSTHIEDRHEWMKDFIIGLTETLTGETIEAEDNFGKIIRDVQKYGEEFSTKVQDKMGQGFIDDEFLFSEDVIVETIVEFKTVDLNENIANDVDMIKFIPTLINEETGEMILLDNKAVELKALDDSGRFKEKFTVYSPAIKFDKNGDEDKNGNYIRGLDYEVIAIQGEEIIKLGLRPIFPQPVNNLQNLFIENPMMMDTNFVPICFDGKKDIELPQRADTSYPFPEDADFPAECKTAIDNFVPSCFNGTKEIDLTKNDDGTYPFPGEPNFPKECLANFDKPLLMTDCEGNEFPKKADGDYILPQETDFNKDNFKLDCMADDYFDDNFKNDFKDKFEVMDTDCLGNELPLNSDNKPMKIEEIMKNDDYANKYSFECMNLTDWADFKPTGENVNSENKHCDFNFDGIVDNFETSECKDDLKDKVNDFKDKIIPHKNDGETPTCKNENGDIVEVPMSATTGTYSLPEEDIWGTVCIDNPDNKMDNNNAKDMANTAKDMIKF